MQLPCQTASTHLDQALLHFFAAQQQLLSLRSVLLLCSLRPCFGGLRVCRSGVETHCQAKRLWLHATPTVTRDLRSGGLADQYDMHLTHNLHSPLLLPFCPALLLFAADAAACPVPPAGSSASKCPGHTNAHRRLSRAGHSCCG